MSLLLSTDFNTPYNTLPFDQFNIEDYLPAIQEAIKIADEEINTITQNTNPANFENTIEAMENSGQLLDQISSVFFNLNSCHTSPRMQELAREISPLLSEHSSNIIQNEPLFERVKKVYEQKEQLKDPEQKMLLERSYKSFVRNGALLNEQAKNRLREIDKEKSQLGLHFGENVLAETNSYTLQLTDEKELEGLPSYAIDLAKNNAEKKKLEGWVITLDYPSYIPFMTYAKNRSLRKQLFKAFGAKGFQQNEYNNENIIQRIVALREERSQLLGYNSYADYVLEERMALSAPKVFHFLEDLANYALPVAKNELATLQQFAKDTDGIKTLERWDMAYYGEKLKKSLFEIDDEALKPYFQLENAIDGMFTLAQKLFGIQFVQTDTIPVYHEEVKTYFVKNNEDKTTGILYADFFPRESKRQGAWMTSYREQSNYPSAQIPFVSIVCNFSPPTKDSPSLLTFNELTTLFHEFGHALHGLLSNTKYKSLSGTNVFWDFVELPSQLMENWCYEPACLNLFAKHYKTGEIIPTEYITKIKESANFQEGLATVRQVSLGYLDMKWHSVAANTIKNVKEFEQTSVRNYDLLSPSKDTCTSCSFSHIFQGGYAAGYYSYKWAEVLEADVFESFKEEGILNTTTGERLKQCILEKGGSEHPMKLFIDFKGREPDPKALVKKAGLL